MDFYALYTSVGLWNAVYVIMYAITNATKLMKYSTRSTEEIFALFICIAFTVDAFKETEIKRDFKESKCYPKNQAVEAKYREDSESIPLLKLFSKAFEYTILSYKNRY